MVTCRRVTKSFLGALKWFLFLLLPMALFAGVYFLVSYFLIIPMIQSERSELAQVIFLLLAYFVLVMWGICAVLVERWICNKDSNERC